MVRLKLLFIPSIVLLLGIFFSLVISSPKAYPSLTSMNLGIGSTAPSESPTPTPIPTPTPTPTPSPEPSPTPTPTPIAAPTVTITNPLDGSYVKRGSTVNITANASDSLGISKVEFYVNNALTCSDATAGYSCSWSVPRGQKTTYTLTAKAYSISGLTAQNNVTVKSR